MVKISQLYQDEIKASTDVIPTVDVETNQTKKVSLLDLQAALFGSGFFGADLRNFTYNHYNPATLGFGTPPDVSQMGYVVLGGQTVIIHIKLTFRSVQPGGQLKVAFPTGFRPPNVASQWVYGSNLNGAVCFYKVSGAIFHGGGAIYNSHDYFELKPLVNHTATTMAELTQATPTQPFAFAAGDYVEGWCVYEGSGG